MNTQNAEVGVKVMAGVPEHEIAALRILSGYDQMLEISRVTKQYDVTEAELMEALNAVAQPSQSSMLGKPAPPPLGSPAPPPLGKPAPPSLGKPAPPSPDTLSTSATAPFTPDVKEAPSLPSTATMLDKSNFRFEYDPSQEAAQRRATVAQAILCPGCGVALGIPDVRPIKVTCPQCLQETVFNA